MRKQLIDYYPPEIRKVLEYQLICATVQKTLDKLAAEADQVLDDQFVLTAGINGVKRYEAVFGITPKDTDSLEDRRFRILTKVNEELPYTFQKLKNMLETLCGAGNFSAEEIQPYGLSVRIGLAASSNYNDVVALLERIVPANIELDVSLLYVTNDRMEGYTHRYLSEFTHDYLRNEGPET